MALTDDDYSSRITSSLPLDALDQLSRLHHETRQTHAHARFLASSVHAALLFMVSAILVLLLARTESLGRDFSWALMILLGVLALLECYVRTHAALFSEASSARVKELRLVFFYMGLVWGAGAFLALPADPGPLSVFLFMALPSAILAFLVPDAWGFTLFLAPAGLITIAAALTRLFPHAGLDMSLILIVQWGLFNGAFLRNREPLATTLHQG
jgi:hypothetical protein